MTEDRPAAVEAGIRLRPMRPADLQITMPYEIELFGTEAWSRQSYLDELADRATRTYLVAESRDGDLLGSGGVMCIAETAQILTVGVLPQARRRGVGRVLVRGLIAEARRRRAEELLLEVRMDNAAARSLYESEGFGSLGVRRGYYEGGRVDALTMRLPLTAEVAP